MGGEKWYGIPNYGEFVLTYYNDDLFQKHRCRQAHRLRELRGGTGKVRGRRRRSAGQRRQRPPRRPLAVPARPVQAPTPPGSTTTSCTTARSTSTAPRCTYAVDKYQEWLDKGYFDKKDVGLKGNDMTEQFVAQKRPIMVGGNRWFGGLSTDITNFQWSTAPHPGSDDTLGSGGNHWVIPTKAKNKKLAEDFIAITMSDKIQKLIGEEGNVLACRQASTTSPTRSPASSSTPSPRARRTAACPSTPTGRSPATPTPGRRNPEPHERRQARHRPRRTGRPLREVPA
ncbi:extracellular solute-binding protein [Streptomyces thinghirensis]|nr:extracellular solute-binding protein [Streptomyces thinghirensis]